MKRPLTKRAGFTIVEVVVALGILLIGMTSVLGLLSFGAAMSRTAQLRSAAASAAEGVVADLEESLFPLVIDPLSGETRVGEPQPVVDRPVPGQPGLLYSATAVAEPPREGEDAGPGPRRWRVDVEMSWTASGRQHTKTFTTLLLGEVPFGERLRRELMDEQPEEPTAAPPETGRQP